MRVDIAKRVPPLESELYVPTGRAYLSANCTPDWVYPWSAGTKTGLIGVAAAIEVLPIDATLWLGSWSEAISFLEEAKAVTALRLR